MHEMGIAMQLIEIASAAIPPEMAGVSIGRVNLRIGKLSAVVPDSLRFCFEMAAKETALDGAELHIEEIPVRARCRACGAEWTITGPAFRCEACASGDIDILSGRELDIVSLEVAE
ncbi:MAG: hydrogenase maturation nickel metallochaperone HypA [Thermodesulfobacteriota bacterium]